MSPVGGPWDTSSGGVVKSWFDLAFNRRDRAKAACPNCGGDAADNWFDRSLCACGVMHTCCAQCGYALDDCSLVSLSRQTHYPATPVDCLISELRELFGMNGRAYLMKDEFEARVAEFNEEVRIGESPVATRPQP